MYVPASNRIDDLPTLHAFLQRHSFATVVTAGVEPAISHLPLLIDPARGPFGTLMGHFARANPHWKLEHSASMSIVVFHGPHAYISPSWYPSTDLAVPTWNYAAVHATGRLKVFDDTDRKRSIVRALAGHFEPSPRPRHNIPSADAEAKLLQAIVAFEMPIDRLEGKFKLSQTRAREDQAGAIEGLEKQGDPESLALAAFSRRHLNL